MRHIPFRRVLTTLAAFALLCIVILIMDRRSLLDPVRDGLSQVLEPAVAQLENIVQPAPAESDAQKRLATAEAEVDSLRSENARLKGELDQLQVLKEQLRVEGQRPDLNFVSAEVIGHDPSGTSQMIIIDRGTADGLRVGMAVVDPDYYVGQIVDVEQHKAKVLLITDPTATVGAVFYTSGADGVIYGSSNGDGTLTMAHVVKSTKVGDQEWVMTSNKGESETAQIPQNILIGYVVGEPTLNAQTDQLEVTIQPQADVQHLEHVWIVVPND